MKPEVKWINIFVRDLLLVLTTLALNYLTKFNSKVVWLINGMLIVLVSWHLSDYMRIRKALE